LITISIKTTHYHPRSEAYTYSLHWQ